jgi:hypothetical protein
VDLRYWVIVGGVALVLATVRLTLGAPLKQLEQLVTILVAGALAGLLFTPPLMALFGISRR